ncbi:hypothetical protein K1719_016386 [Acacia pycnantha]|nr:hypothetical protein K1719_016386 [Acacia pycnantha]
MAYIPNNVRRRDGVLSIGSRLGHGKEEDAHEFFRDSYGVHEGGEPFGAERDLRERNISSERIESIGTHRRSRFGLGRKDPFGGIDKGRGGFQNGIASEDLGGQGVSEDLRKHVSLMLDFVLRRRSDSVEAFIGVGIFLH